MDLHQGLYGLGLFVFPALHLVGGFKVFGGKKRCCRDYGLAISLARALHFQSAFEQCLADDAGGQENADFITQPVVAMDLALFQ